ncbi:uncharacterized protein LOC142351213 [Convolutriloba macropyga]|uniref:uncharacterized protein LOC142351213 n=1 Tax=Convolutriloba macropyga TaxID=536237 RepID=UPI003F5276AD
MGLLHLKLCIFAALILTSAESQLPERDNFFKTTPPSPEWESLTFWLSLGVGLYGQLCRQFSAYYCLDRYRTQNPHLDTGANVGPALELVSVQAWYNVLMQNLWHKINFINLKHPTDCCRDQTMKYLVHGLHNKEWNPQQYISKLTDYDNETKPLNYISAMGLSARCENLILEVGFGPGDLRRSHHNSVVEGAPYVIAGRQHNFDDIGIPHIDSRAFDYENPGEHLTFHWFKHNIMCKGQPWICGGGKKPKIDSKPAKQGGAKKGGKKSRRKNQQTAS